MGGSREGRGRKEQGEGKGIEEVGREGYRRGEQQRKVKRSGWKGNKRGRGDRWWRGQGEKGRQGRMARKRGGIVDVQVMTSNEVVSYDG